MTFLTINELLPLAYQYSKDSASLAVFLGIYFEISSKFHPLINLQECLLRQFLWDFFKISGQIPFETPKNIYKTTKILKNPQNTQSKSKTKRDSSSLKRDRWHLYNFSPSVRKSTRSNLSIRCFVRLLVHKDPKREYYTLFQSFEDSSSLLGRFGRNI
jgi:hypothetical protein